MHIICPHWRLIATSIEKFAVEVRGLQKSEIREVEESFAKGQKGSSAMPHKRNPIGSENMTRTGTCDSWLYVNSL